MKLARPIDTDNPKISTPFSPSHTGIDYAYGDGTPVYASQSGTVVIAKTGEKRQWIANTATDPYKPTTGTRALKTEDYGNFIKIDHGEGITTLYAHLKYMSNSVKTGDKVGAGQMISQVGSTGNSTGNHTHYEVRLNDKTVDPSLYVDPSFKPYFYKPEGGDVMATITQKELDQLIKDRDSNHRDRMALYEALGFSGDFNKTIAIEKIEMFNKLEKAVKEKDDQLSKTSEDLAALQTTLAQAKKEVELMQEQNKALSTAFEKQRNTIDGLTQEVVALQAQINDTQLAWWEPIVKIFVKIFVRR